MSLNEILQESLLLDEKEKILIIEELQKSLSENRSDNYTLIKKDRAFGLLKQSNIDPVAWQNKLRSENDSDIYR